MGHRLCPSAGHRSRLRGELFAQQAASELYNGGSPAPTAPRPGHPEREGFISRFSMAAPHVGHRNSEGAVGLMRLPAASVMTRAERATRLLCGSPDSRGHGPSPRPRRHARMARQAGRPRCGPVSVKITRCACHRRGNGFFHLQPPALHGHGPRCSDQSGRENNSRATCGLRGVVAPVRDLYGQDGENAASRTPAGYQRGVGGRPSRAAEVREMRWARVPGPLRRDQPGTSPWTSTSPAGAGCDHAFEEGAQGISATTSAYALPGRSSASGRHTRDHCR